MKNTMPYQPRLRVACCGSSCCVTVSCTAAVMGGDTFHFNKEGNAMGSAIPLISSVQRLEAPADHRDEDGDKADRDDNQRGLKEEPAAKRYHHRGGQQKRPVARLRQVDSAVRHGVFLLCGRSCGESWLAGSNWLRPPDLTDGVGEADGAHQAIRLFEVVGLVTHQQRLHVLEYPELFG